MTYTEQIREHFATDIPKQKSKRELLLLGILANADVRDGRITAVFGSPYAAYAAKDLCKILRNLSSNISERPFGKRTEYTFVCENEKLAQFFTESDQGLYELMENAESLKYYLRGLFLSCGRITDPHARSGGMRGAELFLIDLAPTATKPLVKGGESHGGQGGKECLGGDEERGELVRGHRVKLVERETT